MKRACILAISAIVFWTFNSFANTEESFTRGFLLAVDTRDHKACEQTALRIQGMSGLKISSLCAQDGRHPFAVAVITVPIDEFEYLAEITKEGGSYPKVAREDRTSLIVSLPRSRDTETYFRISARRDRLSITVFRESTFGAMEERRESFVQMSFLMKGVGPRGMKDTQVASSLDRRLVYNRGATELTQSQYKSVAANAANIMDAVNGAIQNVTSPRVSLDLFIPPDVCESNRYCRGDELIRVGVSVVIHF
ncbi:MAG: hypothetical protein OM95_10820 [Bdellovibrio sp. ArHS]|uniref:hypothetical protein n=1 Tax=Bdellovibrio sp. ArHS TaxID=1569284 RepID=UPI0005826664|nr:hypothetical protein [Bdellovibrio sp. ArHS]KHD88012.1 MAG: hypothetical protein OM95_10820 [Bdellovibrio sp. ArHS]